VLLCYSEEVERCQKWSNNITQQIDLAFNIFFMVYFFIRVSKSARSILVFLSYDNAEENTGDLRDSM